MENLLSLDIVGWDGVLTCNVSNSPRPLIYVKPTKDFIDLVSHNSKFYAYVDGTPNKLYSNVVYICVADRSVSTYGCRPNFYNATDLYTITFLNAPWNGIPGRISFNPQEYMEGKPLKNQGKLYIVKNPYLTPVKNPQKFTTTTPNIDKRKPRKPDEGKLLVATVSAAIVLLALMAVGAMFYA